MNICGEFGRILACAARQIRPANRPHEQCIARQYEPRVGSALQIRHEEAHAVRGVAGCMDDSDPRVPQLDVLAVLQRRERQCDIG